MAFHPLPLGVEQVRDAVQCDHGLPGSRATLDHQHPWVLEADDLVLFGLDRRNDVAHPVTARRVDRRKQSVVPSLANTWPAENLIGEIDHLAPAGMELASPAHVLRAGGSGHVERARCRGPPIEQQRFVVVLFVGEADATDVHMFARNAVQPTETQPVVRHVQPPQLSDQCAHLGIAMNECLSILEIDGTPQRSAVATFTRARSASSRAYSPAT